jgi:hypothetical protein
MAIRHTIRQLELTSSRQSNKSPLRQNAGEVVLKLQECSDSGDSIEGIDEAISEYWVVESWGKRGFQSVDWKGHQGGTEELYYGLDRTTAEKTLWERAAEWRAHGYDVQGATTSGDLETLVSFPLRKGGVVAPPQDTVAMISRSPATILVVVLREWNQCHVAQGGGHDIGRNRPSSTTGDCGRLVRVALRCHL